MINFVSPTKWEMNNAAMLKYTIIIAVVIIVGFASLRSPQIRDIVQQIRNIELLRKPIAGVAEEVVRRSEYASATIERFRACVRKPVCDGAEIQEFQAALDAHLWVIWPSHYDRFAEASNWALSNPRAATDYERFQSEITRVGSTELLKNKCIPRIELVVRHKERQKTKKPEHSFKGFLCSDLKASISPADPPGRAFYRCATIPPC